MPKATTFRRPVFTPCFLKSLLVLAFAVSLPGFARTQNSAVTNIPSLGINLLLIDHHTFRSSAKVRGGVLTEHLTPGSHHLLFYFGPSATNQNWTSRLRYQLDGLETDWQEAGGEMRIGVFFYSTNSEIVGNIIYPVRGDSKGWRGSLENSTFNRHLERVVVPEGARSMQVKITSGDTLETVGLIAFKDFKVFQSGGTNAPRVNLWPYTSLNHDTNAAAPSPKLAGWAPGGFPSRMAQVLALPSGQRILAVVDDSRNGYAEWISEMFYFRDDIQPGDSLELIWQQLFTVGMAAGRSVDYSHVAPGNYTFRVKAVSPLGAELGQQSSLAICIPNFIWQTTWFVTLVLILAAGGLGYWVRYLTRRRLQFRLERLEHQRAVQRERERIARDIHDDLGANLAQIAMLSELAQTDLHHPEQARQRLNKIFDVATSLTRQLDETVWAVNPLHDSLEDIIAFLGNFAQEHCRLAGIRCRFDMPEMVPSLALTSAPRHNLFLAAKEALQNAVKHSRATEVWIRLQLRGEDLIFIIEDNGQGLARAENQPPGTSGGGNGLLNMRRRLEEIGGRFEIESRPGQGTTVRLILFGAMKSSRPSHGAAPGEMAG